MKSHRFAIRAFLALAATVVLLSGVWSSPKHEPSPTDVAQQLAHPDAAEHYWSLRIGAEGIDGRYLRQGAEYARSLPARSQIASKQSATTDWQSTGPNNVAGRIRAVAIDRSDPDKIFVGGATGDLWRSTDGGVSWGQVASATSGFLGVSAIIQDPRDGYEDQWYAATGEDRKFTYQTESSLLKSSDGGASWTDVGTGWVASSGIIGQLAYRLTIHPVSGLLYAVTRSNLFVSSDGGESWTSELALGRDQLSDVFIAEDGCVFVAGPVGVQRSCAQGQWTDISPSSFEAGRRVLLSGSGSVLYAFADRGRNAELWRYDGSAVEGQRWEDRSGQLASFGGFETYNGYTMALQVNPDDPDNVFVGGVKLWVSYDGGFESDESMLPLNATVGRRGSLGHADHHALQFMVDGSVLSTSDGGIHRLLTSDVRAFIDPRDAAIWVPDQDVLDLNSGLVTTQFYHICIPPAANDDRIMGGMQDNGTKLLVDSNGEWEYRGWGDGHRCQFSSDERYVYHSYWALGPGPVYREDLQGGVWPYARLDREGYRLQESWIIDPHDENIIYVEEEGGVFRNKNVLSRPFEVGVSNEDGWVQIATKAELGMTGSSRCWLTDFEFAGTDPGAALVVSSECGQVAVIENPSGERPTVASSVKLTQGPIGAVTIHPSKPSEMLAVSSWAFPPAVYLSQDAGRTWRNVTGNLSYQGENRGKIGPLMLSVAVLPTTSESQLYFVGTTSGLFSTSLLSDYPIWTREDEGGLGFVPVTDIKTRADDGFVAIGTYGRGTYTRRYAVEGGGILAPVAGLDAFATDEDVPLVVNASSGLLSNDSAPSGDGLTVIGSSEPAHGALLLNDNGSFTYTPDENYFGPDTFTYRASDGAYLSTETMVTITVAAVNDAPTESSITNPTDGGTLAIEGDPSQSFTVNWSAATDVDGDTVKYSWYLAAASSPTTPLFSIEGVETTEAATTFGIIAGAMTAAGIPTGATADLVHWIVSSDGTDETVGPSASIIMLRGTITSTERAEEMPDRVALEANYPNPFNPSTMIRFALPEAANVTLSVYDLTGRLVETLINGPMGAGEHEVTFRADDLPSGVYLYRLSADDFEQTRQMVLMK